MDDYLKNKVIITKDDVKKFKVCEDDYAYTYLNRLSKKNKIKKIIKGYYSTSDDIFLIASNIHFPCYISFLTASYLRGYTKQIINRVHIVTSKSYELINHENYVIKFHKLNKKYFFGFEKEKIKENYLFIADNEKLLIDALLFPENMGNFEEIINLVKNIKINCSNLIKYLNRINNISLNKRLGYLLERYRNIDIFNNVKTEDRNYISLSIFNDFNKIDSKWRIKYDFA